MNEGNFRMNFNKIPDPNLKENKLEDGEDKKVFFKDADELLNVLKTLPNFGEGSKDIEQYTKKALEELKNDKEALAIFKETSDKFLELQEKIVEKIRHKTHMLESERDNGYGDKRSRRKLRMGLHGIASVFNSIALTDILQRGIKTDSETIIFYLLPIMMNGFAMVGNIAMSRHVSKKEKEIKTTRDSINSRNKLQSFLEYVSLVGSKEKDGYSYNKELSQKLANLNIGENALKGFFELHNNLVQNESIDLLHGLEIAGRYANKFDDENELKLLVGKLIEMSPEDKFEYESYLENLLTNLSENKNLGQVDDFEYKMLCKQVYPPGNYDTFEHLDKYKDHTNDLDKYKFNREGMDIYIDGMSGYKLRDGTVPNPEILKEYSVRLEKINDISRPKTLTEFLEKNTTTDAETVEGKLLSYLEQNNYSKDAFDVVIAYQLGEDYAQLIQRSQDQVVQFEDVETKEYIQLAELADIYGDNLKETIKHIVKKIRESKDASLFEKTSVLSGKQLVAGERLAEDLKILPEQARNNVVIQKKVETTFKNIFQGDPIMLQNSKEFSLLFSTEDFNSNIAELWRIRLENVFSSQVGNMIDVSALQTMQNKAFQEIQSEAQKYQELVEVETSKEGPGERKLKKLRHLKTYFSKNKENAHARMVAHVCIATNYQMLENPNYFELVIFDPERKRNMGTTMLLTMEEPDNKKYLLYNPNPSVGLVSEVSAKRLYKMMTDQVIEFAKENNFDGILVNPNHGASTNRGGLFLQALQQSTVKENDSDKKINLSKEHTLGGGYKYKNDLSIIWEK